MHFDFWIESLSRDVFDFDDFKITMISNKFEIILKFDHSMIKCLKSWHFLYTHVLFLFQAY